MSTHNIGFYEDLTKIIFELPSNTHLISSAGYGYGPKLILIGQQRLISRLLAEQNSFEPRCEKTGLRGFLPGPIQTTTQDG